MKKASVLAGTGLAALALGLGLAGPAAASTTQTAEPLVSGGGCNKSTNPFLSGVNISVCISNRGTSGTVYPDLYVNEMLLVFGCDIQMVTYDDTSGGHLTWDFHECPTSGHLQFPPFPATAGHRYSAYVYVETNGGNTSTSFGPSPELYY